MAIPGEMRHSEKLMLPNGLLMTPFKGDSLYEVGNMVFRPYTVRLSFLSSGWSQAKNRALGLGHSRPRLPCVH